MVERGAGLAARLRRMREEAGLAPAQAVALSGVPEDAIMGFESGARRPDVEALVRLADAFGADPRLLLAGSTGKDGEAAGMPLMLRRGGLRDEDLPALVEAFRLLRNLRELEELLGIFVKGQVGVSFSENVRSGMTSLPAMLPGAEGRLGGS